jgi:O-antigen ligase
MNPSLADAPSESVVNRAIARMMVKDGSMKRLHGPAVLMLLVLGHVILALLFKFIPLLSPAFLAGVLAIGIWRAMRSKSLEEVAYVCAYFVGCEVLWRMTDGAFFWEIGKFGVIVIIGVALLNQRKADPPGLPLGYFILLLPAALISAQYEDFGSLRQDLSFYLSGPLAILFCAWLFSRLTITPAILQRILLWLIVPTAGIAFLSFFGITTATEIDFTTESNFQTSGGFGPNQVSVILGFGALSSFLLGVVPGQDGRTKYIAVILMMILFGFSLITFSRSGVVLFGASLLVATLLLMKSKRVRSASVALVLLATAVGAISLPMINDFTGGALKDRYVESDSSGRTELAKDEIEMWKENPIFGAGVGRVPEIRAESGKVAASHTEFTRLVGEHGTLGMTALLLLAISLVRNVLRNRDAVTRSVVTAFAVWGSLFMVGNALRVAAPAFAIGITFATFKFDGSGNETVKRIIAAKEYLKRRLVNTHSA